MITENPTHLNCPYCPAQSFVGRVREHYHPYISQVEYKCPGGHHFFIETEDTSFNFGYNKEIK